MSQTASIPTGASASVGTIYSLYCKITISRRNRILSPVTSFTLLVRTTRKAWRELASRYGFGPDMEVVVGDVFVVGTGSGKIQDRYLDQIIKIPNRNSEFRYTLS